MVNFLFFERPVFYLECILSKVDLNQVALVFYLEYIKNNKSFNDGTTKKILKLTEDLHHAIDHGAIVKVWTENYELRQDVLRMINRRLNILDRCIGCM